MSEALTGGCLCGAVRYSTRGAPINVYVCHCRLCQKVLGATFNVRALFPREAVAIEGAYTTFASSTDLDRGFCPTCGSTMFFFRHSAKTTGVTLGSLDDPDACRAPTLQVWAASKQNWVRLEGLPSVPGTP